MIAWCRSQIKGSTSCFFVQHSCWSKGSDDPSWKRRIHIHYSDGLFTVSKFLSQYTFRSFYSQRARSRKAESILQVSGQGQKKLLLSEIWLPWNRGSWKWCSRIVLSKSAEFPKRTTSRLWALDASRKCLSCCLCTIRRGLKGASKGK